MSPDDDTRGISSAGRALALQARCRRFDPVIPHHYHRGVEQLAARRAHNPKVVGSSPSPATKLRRRSSVG